MSTSNLIYKMTAQTIVCKEASWKKWKMGSLKPGVRLVYGGTSNTVLWLLNHFHDPEYYWREGTQKQVPCKSLRE